MKRVLYIQYTDPAAYPPLEHSSFIFAERGWEVRHLGIVASGAAASLLFPENNAIEVKLMPKPGGGWRTQLHYMRFISWCFSEVKYWRPDVVYCSDFKSYPIGFFLSKLQALTVVMHEHDPPDRKSHGAMTKLFCLFRKLLAKSASYIIIPQKERARMFLTDTVSDASRLSIVYNCPSIRDLQKVGPVTNSAKATFILWYHGAIGPQQFPLTTIDALSRLPEDVQLEFAGYETIGNKDYVQALRAHAQQLGVSDRVLYKGAIPQRRELLKIAAMKDLGLALFKSNFRDPMVGASNKPFDYLACGLPLLTNLTEEWEDFFGSEGVSVGCDPDNPNDIARQVLHLRNNPELRRAMAERGQVLIRTKWNYEEQFFRVFSKIDKARI